MAGRDAAGRGLQRRGHRGHLQEEGRPGAAHREEVQRCWTGVPQGSPGVDRSALAARQGGPRRARRRATRAIARRRVLDGQEGVEVNHVDSTVSAVIMSELLGIFAEEAGRCACRRPILVMHGAGWHTAADVVVPEGVHLLFLPAYSPELQPFERVWPVINEEVANRTVTQVDEWMAAIDRRCEHLESHRDDVRDRTLYRWWPREKAERRCDAGPSSERRSGDLAGAPRPAAGVAGAGARRARSGGHRGSAAPEPRVAARSSTFAPHNTELRVVAAPSGGRLRARGSARRRSTPRASRTRRWTRLGPRRRSRGWRRALADRPQAHGLSSPVTPPGCVRQAALPAPTAARWAPAHAHPDAGHTPSALQAHHSRRRSVKQSSWSRMSASSAAVSASSGRPRERASAMLAARSKRARCSQKRRKP